VRQKDVDVLVRGGCQPGEDVDQPGFEADLAGLAGGDHAVDDGSRLPALVIAEEQPVLASQRPGAEGVLVRIAAWTGRRRTARTVPRARILLVYSWQSPRLMVELPFNVISVSDPVRCPEWTLRPNGMAV